MRLVLRGMLSRVVRSIQRRVLGTRPLPFNRRFDRILVDAPCSGSGTWRRQPHLKWYVKLETIFIPFGRVVRWVTYSVGRQSRISSIMTSFPCMQWFVVPTPRRGAVGFSSTAWTSASTARSSRAARRR